jgi:hypothetical protein
MPGTTPRGAPFSLGSDTADTIDTTMEALARWADARPGVSPLTTAQRDALAGADLWDGRVIWNITTARLERYNAGTATWRHIGLESGGLLSGRVSLGVGGELSPYFPVNGGPALASDLPRSYPVGISYSGASNTGGWPGGTFGVVLTFRLGTDVWQVFAAVTGNVGHIYMRAANSSADAWGSFREVSDSFLANLPHDARFLKGNDVDEGGQFIIEGAGVWPHLLIDRFRDNLRGIVGNTERWSINDVGSARFPRNEIREGYVGTFESTTSTPYTNLPTVGPTVEFQAPLSGRLLFLWSAAMQNNTNGHQGLMDLLVADAAGTVIAGGNDSTAARISGANTNNWRQAGHKILNLIGGATYTARPIFRVTGGTGTFGERLLEVIPSL